MFSFTQILLIMLIWIVYQVLSNMMILTPYGTAVLIGWATGAVLGDPTTGLLIGGTMELMSIGMNPLGGSSVPDYYTGTIVGVAFAVGAGKGMDVGIATGIPVGVLCTQIDVFNKMIGVFFAHKISEANERMDFKAMNSWVIWRFVACIVLSCIPVFLILVVGEGFVNMIVDDLPQWFMNGLSAAGGVLPAVGFAILLHSLPLKSNFQYVILGYVLAAYFGAPVLAVSLLALVIAMVYYYNTMNRKNTVAVAANTDGGITDDE